MILDLLDNIHAVWTVHHVDGKTFFAKTSCAANPVKVCLAVSSPVFVHRKIKVDYN